MKKQKRAPYSKRLEFWTYYTTETHKVFLWVEDKVEYRIARPKDGRFGNWISWVNNEIFLVGSKNSKNMLRRMRFKYPFLPNRLPLMGEEHEDIKSGPVQKFTPESFVTRAVFEPLPVLTEADFLPRVKFDIPDQSDGTEPKKIYPIWFDKPIEGTDVD